MVTYCLPSTEYVMGAALTCPPRLVLHNSAPVRASSARKWPSRDPEKMRSEAVASRPLLLMFVNGNFHFVVPVRGSIADTAPVPFDSVPLVMTCARMPPPTPGFGASFRGVKLPPIRVWPILSSGSLSVGFIREDVSSSVVTYISSVRGLNDGENQLVPPPGHG